MKVLDELFFDIETLPVMDERKVELFNLGIKPPGNIKLEASKQKWLDNPDNLDEARKKTSFDAAWGSVLCIGYAINDEPPVCLHADTEAELLNQWLQVCRFKLDGGTTAQRNLIGHYSKGFDAPFLSQRMMIHGLGPLFPFSAKPWDTGLMCTGEMFSGNPRDIPSLAKLCAAFDVDSPKQEFDGSEVYQRYLDGDLPLILAYCRRDVEATRQVYRKMTGSRGGIL